MLHKVVDAAYAANEVARNIENEINQIQARPSFNNTTITISAGESKTITDTNGVLAEYNSIDETQDGIRYQHSKGSNNMTITVNENVEKENIRISDNTFQSWGMIKEGTEDNDTTVFFEFPSGTQDQLYAMHYNDPVTLNLSGETICFVPSCSSIVIVSSDLESLISPFSSNTMFPEVTRAI